MLDSQDRHVERMLLPLSTRAGPSLSSSGNDSTPAKQLPRFMGRTTAFRHREHLCFKHRRRVARDNTVKYYRHTRQLLPSQQRRRYAGAVVVVLEGLDGRLSL